MRVTTKKILCDLDNIPNYSYLFNKNIMIFDIETTGFSKDNAIIYMIGCIYKKNDIYEYCNILAENPSQESEIIDCFFSMLEDIQCLIHFNGNKFDIPFLLARAQKYKIKDSISHIESIDVYELLRPFRKSLDLPNLKLDTLQLFLGYNREDTFTGGDLIKVYHNYTHQPNEVNYKMLVLHNKEDVEGMINLIPLIDIIKLIDNIISYSNISVLNTTQYRNHVSIIYELPYVVFSNFTLSFNEAKLVFSPDTHNIEFFIPIYEGEKKLFFENYKEYMYIPERDEAIHKSIAQFMPTHKKIQANKSNCYVSHIGLFIPTFNRKNIQQAFKDSSNSKRCFALLSQSFSNEFYKSQLVGFLTSCKGL